MTYYINNLLKAVKVNDSLKVIEYLQAGENPNFTESGESPLKAAIRNENTEIMGLLLENPDTDINQLDENNETPLFVAARLGHIDAVRTLLIYGADYNIQCNGKVLSEVIPASIPVENILNIDLQSSKIFPIQNIYPNSDSLEKGICFGVSEAAKQAILLGELKIFQQRFALIRKIGIRHLKITIEQAEKERKKIVYEINQKYKKVEDEIKNCNNDFNIQNEKLKKIYQQKQKEIDHKVAELPGDTPSILQIKPYFEAVKVYQTEGLDYRNTEKKLMPKALENFGGIVHRQFYGVYDLKKLEIYIRSLHESLINENKLKDPISISLDSESTLHQITITFDRKTNLWTLIDVNIDKLENSEDVVLTLAGDDLDKVIVTIYKALLLSFDKKALSVVTNVASRGCDWPLLQNFVDKWLALPEMCQIQKLNSHDAANVSCLLFYALNEAPGLIPSLISEEIDPNMEDEEDNSLLNVVINLKKNDVLLQLIAHGGDVNRMDNAGNIPIFTAIETGNNEALRILLNNPNINLQHTNKHGDSPLHAAVKTNNLQAIVLLLENETLNVNQQNKLGDTPLYTAFKVGNVEAVKKQFNSKRKLNIRHKNYRGVTAIDLSQNLEVFGTLINEYQLKTPSLAEVEDLNSDTDKFLVDYKSLLNVDKLNQLKAEDKIILSNANVRMAILEIEIQSEILARSARDFYGQFKVPQHFKSDIDEFLFYFDKANPNHDFFVSPSFSLEDYLYRLKISFKEFIVLTHYPWVLNLIDEKLMKARQFRQLSLYNLKNINDPYIFKLVENNLFTIVDLLYLSDYTEILKNAELAEFLIDKLSDNLFKNIIRLIDLNIISHKQATILTTEELEILDNQFYYSSIESGKMNLSEALKLNKRETRVSQTYFGSASNFFSSGESQETALNLASNRSFK